MLPLFTIQDAQTGEYLTKCHLGFTQYMVENVYSNRCVRVLDTQQRIVARGVYGAYQVWDSERRKYIDETVK